MTASLTIAIVDDDPFIRLSLDNLLRSAGYGTAVFGAPEDLLRADLAGFDGVISDMQMPAMSGLDLQAALRARAPGLPLIFLTGFPDPRIRSRAMAAGARAFLTKPCAAEVLLECLAAVLAPPTAGG